MIISLLYSTGLNADEDEGDDDDDDDDDCDDEKEEQDKQLRTLRFPPTSMGEIVSKRFSHNYGLKETAVQLKFEV